MRHLFDHILWMCFTSSGFIDSQFFSYKSSLLKFVLQIHRVHDRLNVHCSIIQVYFCSMLHYKILFRFLRFSNKIKYLNDALTGMLLFALYLELINKILSFLISLWRILLSCKSSTLGSNWLKMWRIRSKLNTMPFC